MFVAIPWQLRWGTVTDTSWIITICERLYGGERLYTDIIEPNPPFTVWLYMPAYLLSVWLRLTPETVVHAYAYAICVFGLGFAAFIAHRARFAENAGLLALLPVFLALLVLLPGNAFTQREQLGAALLVPLLVLTAWRVAADTSDQPHWRIAVAAGLSGSVIVLVKPHYALVIAAPALYLAWRKHSLRPLFGPEYWVIGGVCVTYLGTVLLIYPGYVTEILPLLFETYLQIKQPIPLLLQRYGPGYLLLLLLLWRIRPGVPLSPLAAVFAAASLAGMAVLAYQAKGWPYHAYPALALGLTAVLCQTVRPPAVSTKEIGAVRMMTLAGVLLINALPFLATQKPAAELVSTIRRAADRPSVALVGADIAAGHPLTRMVGGRWVAAHCSDWLGAFALHLADRAKLENDGRAASRYETIASDYSALKLAELERTQPQLLIVQKNDRRWRRHLEDQEDFKAILRDYRLLTEDRSLLVYLREAEAISAASPAAASD